VSAVISRRDTCMVSATTNSGAKYDGYDRVMRAQRD
jgi:hypothetical protein